MKKLISMLLALCLVFSLAVTAFADGETISDYATEAVEKLYKAGIINGTSDLEFKPFELCSRAQAAQLINNAFYQGGI